MEWIAFLSLGALGAIAVGIKLVCDKLDRIIELLSLANRQRDGD
jgi:hypothetical protein